MGTMYLKSYIYSRRLSSTLASFTCIRSSTALWRLDPVFLTTEAPTIGVVSILDPNNSGGTMTGCFFGGCGH
jgi:hypothetical protein